MVAVDVEKKTSMAVDSDIFLIMIWVFWLNPEIAKMLRSGWSRFRNNDNTYALYAQEDLTHFI